VSSGYFLIIIVFFAVLWFMLIRPAKRRQLVHQRMLESVGEGDEIVTAGGLYGLVTEVGDDELRVEIAPGIEVRIARRAVAGVVSQVAEEEDEELPPARQPEPAEPS
jgi:preprotein translocase subunit YajC